VTARTTVGPRDALPSLVAALSWGAMFPIAAAAVEHVDPFHLTAIRYGFATLAFVALLAAVEGRRALRFDGRALELLALGALGFAGFNLLSYVALEHTQPQHAALFVAMSPLLTLMATSALSRTAPRPVTIGFIVLALVGVLMVIGKGDPSAVLHGGVNGGDGLVLLGVLSWVVYTLGARRHADLSPLRFTTLTSIGGIAAILVVTETATLAGWIDAPSLSDVGAIWWHVLYIVVIGAVIAVLAWNDGVKRLGAANASLSQNLVPVVAFAVSIAFQGYHAGAGELLGAGVTVAALFGANLAGREAAVAAVTVPAPAACAAPLADSRAA
jgi:drug/metabolite transporter (DMT)-like permease